MVELDLERMKETARIMVQGLVDRSIPVTGLPVWDEHHHRVNVDFQLPVPIESQHYQPHSGFLSCRFHLRDHGVVIFSHRDCITKIFEVNSPVFPGPLFEVLDKLMAGEALAGQSGQRR
jgi:hypothetical protein